MVSSLEAKHVLALSTISFFFFHGNMNKWHMETASYHCYQFDITLLKYFIYESQVLNKDTSLIKDIYV